MSTHLLQGTARTRPPRGKSQAHTGIQPLSPLTHRTQRFEPLPPPLGEPPYHMKLEELLPGVSGAKKLVLHTVGDTGGIKHPEYQIDVAAAMKDDLALPKDNRPMFFYHLGDVVYYNGEHDQYYQQFYEPYDHYEAPILSIPGNHDGEPLDALDTSLEGWVSYFMTPEPHVDPVSSDAPRVTVSQPNVYFTLECPLATFVGLYSNVPEHGSIDSIQQQWFTNELSNAPKDKALIVCVHHPVYSFDDHHSGSPRMADVLQHAINDSRRVPNMVLTGHVHNYQRIERQIAGKSPTPILVAGHGGYFHLHHLNAENGTVDQDTSAKLVASNDKLHGFVTLTISKEAIAGVMTTITHNRDRQEADKFSYPANALFLPEGEVVSL